MVTGDKIDEPRFIFLMVYITDVLRALSNRGHRIDFKDDLPDKRSLPKPVEDITDLIFKVRDACCHVGSANHKIDFGSLRFVVTPGRNAIFQIGDEKHFVGDYDDDVAIWFGAYRLYYNRHLVRIIDEAEARLIAWALDVGLDRDWASALVGR